MDNEERRKRLAEHFRKKAAYHAEIPKGNECAICGQWAVRNECPDCLKFIAESLDSHPTAPLEREG